MMVKELAPLIVDFLVLKKHILPSLFNKACVRGSREGMMIKEVEAIVKGMRRIRGSQQRIRGKKPLLIENIREMCDIAAQLTDIHGQPMPNKQCRDVYLLFLFFSAMKRSEVQNLLWNDLAFDHRGVIVFIRTSKTDQESKGQTIALPRLNDVKYCPVKALERWKEKSHGTGDSPVFRWSNKSAEIQYRILTDQRIVAIIKRYADKIGLDKTSYAAHSCRSGYVTSSSDRGVPVSELMKRTRHKALSSIQVYMKNNDLFINGLFRVIFACFRLIMIG